LAARVRRTHEEHKYPGVDCIRLPGGQARWLYYSRTCQN
jgi:hypothetical protein